MHDIAYILKEDIDSEELRYSLRSLVNFPHNKVWFFGGCPSWAAPDEHVFYKQVGDTKSDRSTSTFEAICKSGISEQFWLFNDDFFIMQPVESLPYMYHNTLEEHAKCILEKSPWSKYALRLQHAAMELQAAGYSTLNYALHVPMLLEKAKAAEVRKNFSSPMVRSIYGNYWHVGGEEADDVKIYDFAKGDWSKHKMLSTSDNSFKIGAVGKYIRSQLNEKSRYEC